MAKIKFFRNVKFTTSSIICKNTLYLTSKYFINPFWPIISISFSLHFSLQIVNMFVLKAKSIDNGFQAFSFHSFFIKSQVLEGLYDFVFRVGISQLLVHIFLEFVQRELIVLIVIILLSHVNTKDDIVGGYR